VFRWLTKRRRAHLLETPFPAAWREILASNVRAYAELLPEEQARLCELTQVFLAEKHWEGCGGLVLDDEMRVTIAGTTCLLLLGRDHDLMREVESILVYPSTVVLPEPPRSVFDGRPRVVGERTAALGVAHGGGGPVVLAWDAVVQGARNPRDGRNVVLHEMAHKVDFLDGEADGVPPLPSAEVRRAWAASAAAAFHAVQAGEQHLLRDYAGTSEAEFFAVATEVFFEKPRQLASQFPALYDVLRTLYNLDLAAPDRPVR
jgi:MtfA peptidase